MSSDNCELARSLHGITLAFDLDGTLVETAPDLVGATNHAIASEGLGPLALADLRAHVSFGARAMIVEALRRHGHRVSEQRIDELHERFLVHYRRHIADSSFAFPGVAEALDRLRARGARLAVCTNKQAENAVDLLERLALKERFAAIAGRGTFPVMKPHPEHLRGAVRLAGGDPARAIMIGDSETDVLTARAAGVPVIAVSFGYTDKPVARFGPDAVVDSFDEVAAAIGRLASRLNA